MRWSRMVTLWLGLATVAQAQGVAGAAISKERVTFTSGDFALVGYLFRPDRTGPLPAVLWNHGSEKNPDRGPQFDAVAEIFVPAGYVVFAPVRRGHGDSGGPYIESQRQGSQSGALQVSLLEAQVEDQLAGLALLKGLPYVDRGRIAVAGCSYGGIQALLGAERGAGYRAAVAISPGALSWDRNPVLQRRLMLAAERIEIPVFLLQPPRDGSLAPARVLGPELERRNKLSRAEIYPDTIAPNLQAHCFRGVRSGGHIWAKDALDFLAEALR